MSNNTSLVQIQSESLYLKSDVKSAVSSDGAAKIRAIANILAHGVLRLQLRQKQLDLLSIQSVHTDVLPTRGDTE